jgi:hypothetical protein
MWPSNTHLIYKQSSTLCTHYFLLHASQPSQIPPTHNGGFMCVQEVSHFSGKNGFLYLTDGSWHNSYSHLLDGRCTYLQSQKPVLHLKIKWYWNPFNKSHNMDIYEVRWCLTKKHKQSTLVYKRKLGTSNCPYKFELHFHYLKNYHPL